VALFLQVQSEMDRWRPYRCTLSPFPCSLFITGKTSFEAAYRQHHRLIESSRVNFIEVLGGDQSRAIGCKPRDPAFGLSWAHGFSGKEREVVRAITDWVTGEPVPDQIGP
jgi:hypothetical protein